MGRCFCLGFFFSSELTLSDSKIPENDRISTASHPFYSFYNEDCVMFKFCSPENSQMKVRLENEQGPSLNVQWNAGHPEVGGKYHSRKCEKNLVKYLFAIPARMVSFSILRKLDESDLNELLLRNCQIRGFRRESYAVVEAKEGSKTPNIKNWQENLLTSRWGDGGGESFASSKCQWRMHYRGEGKGRKCRGFSNSFLSYHPFFRLFIFHLRQNLEFHRP